MKHEGTHCMIDLYLGYEGPAWFEEGLATFFEYWDLSCSDKENLQKSILRNQRDMSFIISYRGIDSKLPFMDIERLFGLSYEEFYDDNNSTVAYAESRALMTFILTSRVQR